MGWLTVCRRPVVVVSTWSFRALLLGSFARFLVSGFELVCLGLGFGGVLGVVCGSDSVVGGYMNEFLGVLFGVMRGLLAFR